MFEFALSPPHPTCSPSLRPPPPTPPTRTRPGFLRLSGVHAAATAALAGRGEMEPQRDSNASEKLVMSNVGKSTNIVWHDCPIGRPERQMLLKQKGCVIWITGLSGSGKSTLACALSRELHCGGHLTYVLDGDNLRHGLNRDLSFKAEDRTENIRRVGEVAKLFADAGLICIASLISPYRRDRDTCRALVPDSTFVEVFLNIPLEICEARDPKGLYKLARTGKIKGFTGIDDPYEPPLNCEIEIQLKEGECPSPGAMAKQLDGRAGSLIIFASSKSSFLRNMEYHVCNHLLCRTRIFHRRYRIREPNMLQNLGKSLARWVRSLRCSTWTFGIIRTHLWNLLIFFASSRCRIHSTREKRKKVYKE